MPFLVAVLSVALALVACGDPVSVEDVGEAYLGAPGTTRTYRVTEAYYHPGSDNQWNDTVR